MVDIVELVDGHLHSIPLPPLPLGSNAVVLVEAVMAFA